MKLLEIQSSPRGESSDSIALTKSFIEACKSDNTSIVVDTLNVWHERLPEFDYEAIGAKYKAVKHEAMTEAESNVWERIQSLIQRFQSADRIVLGTPMWNFGLPYKLKQLIDLIAQRNYLFAYDGKQYGPLLQRSFATIRMHQSLGTSSLSGIADYRSSRALHADAGSSIFPTFLALRLF